MLLAAGLFMYAWLITFIAGDAAFCQIGRLSKEVADDRGIALIHIAGMAVISGLVGILHLFLPVSALLHGIVIGLLLVYVIISRKRLVSSFRSYAGYLGQYPVFSIILFLVAVLSIVARTGTGDIADYHLQAIKWAEHFPNVRGLGNFNKPLANNYWWFNLQAFFGSAAASVYVMNALMYVSVTLFVYDRFQQSSSRIFYLCLLLFMVFSIKTAFIGAVTTDVYINYIIFILFALAFQAPFSAGNYYLILLLLVFSLTVKITSLMLGGLWLYTTFTHRQLYQDHARSMIKMYGALLLVFILPWIAGNIIQSGYLLPLFDHIDVLNVDWKVPAKYFAQERMVITNWSKLQDEDLAVTAQMSLWEWVPRWFSAFDLFNKSLLILTGISLFLFAAIAIRSLRSRVFSHHFYITLCAIIGLLLMFFSSPQMRFMFGYIVVVIGLVLQAIIPLTDKWMRPANAAILAATIALLGMRVVSVHRQYGLGQVMAVPPPYPKGLVQPGYWGSQTVYLTRNTNTCWDTFPCSYYVLPNTILRGNTIAEGFRNTGN